MKVKFICHVIHHCNSKHMLLYDKNIIYIRVHFIVESESTNLGG